MSQLKTIVSKLADVQDAMEILGVKSTQGVRDIIKRYHVQTILKGGALLMLRSRIEQIAKERK